jgi:hypothetical protein
MALTYAGTDRQQVKSSASFIFTCPLIGAFFAFGVTGRRD